MPHVRHFRSGACHSLAEHFFLTPLHLSGLLCQVGVVIGHGPLEAEGRGDSMSLKSWHPGRSVGVPRPPAPAASWSDLR